MPKPRIITETVADLRHMVGAMIRSGEASYEAADDLLELANELDSYDARETKKDPSKRKRKR